MDKLKKYHGFRLCVLLHFFCKFDQSVISILYNVHTQNYLISVWLNLLPCPKQKESLTNALHIIRQFQTFTQVWKVCSSKLNCRWFTTCRMVHKQDLYDKKLRHDNQPVYKIRLIISKLWQLMFNVQLIFPFPVSSWN